MATPVNKINRNDRPATNFPELASRLVEKLVAGKPATFILEADKHFPSETGSETANPLTIASITANRAMAERFGLAISTNRKFPASQKAIKSGEAIESTVAPGTFYVKRDDALFVTLHGVRDTDVDRAKAIDAFGEDVVKALPVVEVQKRGAAALASAA